jgi:hypothetical protein
VPAAPGHEMRQMNRRMALAPDCDRLLDRRRVKAIVVSDMRDDEAFRREARAIVSSAVSVCCDFTARRTAPRESGSSSGGTARRSASELLDRPFDRQPALVDRGDVLTVVVAEEHLLAVAGEPGADRSADRTRSDDDVLHRATLRPPRDRFDREHTRWSARGGSGFASSVVLHCFRWLSAGAQSE